MGEEDSVNETQEYVVRVEGMPNSYGLGKAINDHVTLFEAGMYNLTHEQLMKKLENLPKVKK
jgi:hypothetical protein